MEKVTKAIFPVAGLGTRFLPATKANPKEMLPIVDKPLIQYAVEEAIASGITQLVFVTSSSKRAIEDHFDTHYELEQRLIQQEKYDVLQMVKNIVPQGVDCIYVRQPQALGLGHAVLCAQQVIGHHPFAVLLADDLIDTEGFSCLQQMLLLYNRIQQSVIAVQEINLNDSDKYGVIDIKSNWRKQGEIEAIVEKPQTSNAPSCFGVVGRYILKPEIFTKLRTIAPDQKGEIQLTDAIAALLNEQAVWALQFEGKRYDCGNKLGYLQATIELGLKHPEVGQELNEYLQNFQRKLRKHPLETKPIENTVAAD